MTPVPDLNLVNLYHRILYYFSRKLLVLFKMEDITHSALGILIKIVRLKANNVTARPIPIEEQVFFLFANRMIIDAESARLLARNGFYGSGYSIIAIMLRTITMYASLAADKNRLDSFWNEEKDTYQTDQVFFNSFKEGSVRNLAKGKFGNDSFDRSELEKLLHGSCYAIRKYYSKKQINTEGKSEPLLIFGKFRQESKEVMIKSIAGAIILDFLGIFFSEHTEKNSHDYDDLLEYYYVVIKRAQIETKYLEKEFGNKEKGKYAGNSYSTTH
jgi:hypothetical protein